MNKDKKSFSEYIDYLLFNKKILNNKTTVLIIILLGIIAGLGLRISFTPRITHGEEGLEYTDEYKANALEECGFSKVEIEEMSEYEKINLSNKVLIQSRNQVAGNEWGDEFSTYNYSELKMKYYKYATMGEYENIVKDFEELKNKYYFGQPYNQRLIRIYNDAYAIKSAFSDKNNLVQQKDTLSKLNDERMLLYALLQSDLEIRNSILKDRMSLTFSSENNEIRINSVNSASMAYMAKNELHTQDANLRRLFEYLNEGDFIIYKINFNLGTDIFNAYLYKNINNMKLDIFGIYAVNKSNLSINYTTVAESEEILSYRENYENYIPEETTNEESYLDNYSDEDEYNIDYSEDYYNYYS